MKYVLVAIIFVVLLSISGGVHAQLTGRVDCQISAKVVDIDENEIYFLILDIGDAQMCPLKVNHVYSTFNNYKGDGKFPPAFKINDKITATIEMSQTNSPKGAIISFVIWENIRYLEDDSQVPYKLGYATSLQSGLRSIEEIDTEDKSLGFNTIYLITLLLVFVAALIVIIRNKKSRFKK